MTMENSTTAMAPFLLRNLITSIFISADKSLLNLSERYKLLQFIRYLLIQLLLFFLRFLPSIFPSLIAKSAADFPHKSHHVKREFPTQGDSGIARALSQILSIINDIPVSSRKYETVRNLAENLIDENLQEGCESLRKVNQSVLSTAFARTLCLLERAMSEQEREQFDGVDYSLNRVLRVVRSLGDGARARLGVGGSREDMLPPGASAEKLAAELLWLAEKLAACRSAEEAVWRWGSASNLARLALSAPPRLQGSLVKVSAFLFKHVKELGDGEEVKDDKDKREKEEGRKMKILMTWLPLLCRASNGTDAPIMSAKEREEVQKVLEETIEMLNREEEQEQVLALWLDHFISCPNSDWPNLQASYVRWCDASRKDLLLH